jgi:ABC-type spermidine/putrescine transport system permease subunit II
LGSNGVENPHPAESSAFQTTPTQLWVKREYGFEQSVSAVSMALFVVAQSASQRNTADPNF